MYWVAAELTNKAILCPSTVCKSGAHLLGIRQEDGTIALLPKPLAIDATFIEKVKAHPVAPESRFRFTNKCVENGCKQWNGKGCGVIEKVVSIFDKSVLNGELPACSIRKSCRWFTQEGIKACQVCTYVVTDVIHDFEIDA